MSRRIPLRYIFLSDSATAVSAGLRVSDFRNCILSIAGSPSANLKVFIKGSVSPSDVSDSPNFDIRSSARNEVHNWDFIEVVDLEDGTAIDGDDGISLSGNVIRLLEVNINSLDWLAVEATAITAGTVTIVGSFTTNQ